MKFFGSLLCLLLVVPFPLSAATVSGKANASGAAVPGVEVMAYPVSALDFSQPPSSTSALTPADGLFRLDLPTGEYYLLARGENLFSFYGRNPVVVPEEGLDERQPADDARQPAGPWRAAQVETGVAGFVTADRPAGAGCDRHGLYRPVQPFKGMGLGWTSPTDQAGYFEAPLSSRHLLPGCQGPQER